MEEFFNMLAQIDWMEMLKDIAIFVVLYLTRGRTEAQQIASTKKKLEKQRLKNEKASAKLEKNLRKEIELQKEVNKNASSK